MAEYRSRGRNNYNPFADTIDIARPNFARAETDAEVKAATKTLNDVMNSAGLETTPDSSTLLGVMRDVVTAQVPHSNAVMGNVKQCESVRGRIVGNMFNDPTYKNCGVCLNGGTKFDNTEAGKYMGGLYIMQQDKEYQEADAKARNSLTHYTPTVGGCEADQFYATQESYERGLNQLDCKESGQSGGFEGKTADGRKVAPQKCAQAPFSGDNVFIYDPKNRRFNVNLRVITPVGTGMCRVMVMDAGGNQVGFGSAPIGGKEFTITINNVSELQDLTVNVALEVPHRNNGKSEVFQYVVNEGGTTQPGYNQSQETAAEICKRIGARSATKNDLTYAWNNGAQLCSSGWASNFVGFMMKGREVNGSCGNIGLVDYRGAWNNMAYSWCYGMKPPASTRQDLFFTKVFPFFNSLGDSTTPTQAGQGDKWSQYGERYQSPFFRGVLLQWENAEGPVVRVAGFESTIVAVNRVPTDMSTGINRVLRKMGTFKGSVMIKGPKPVAGGLMGTNQFWLWSNMHTDQYVRFDVKVPGVFLDPFYSDDKYKAPSGPLITKPETANFLKLDPCMVSGQKPGAYSAECLNNQFVSNGGDPVNGKIVTEGGGIMQLNKLGDIDAIGAYLGNLYMLITTGKDINGVPGTATTINNAGQLMLGMDIAMPCEEVSQDSAGNIVLSKKLGSLESDCLDHLWHNTTSDRDRGSELHDSKSTLNNTYVSIGQRFSGLRNREASKVAREQFPFQTCQRTGFYSPIDKYGKDNNNSIQVANSKAVIERQKACSSSPSDPRCKSGSLVEFVQDYYNSIFEKANNLADRETEEEHQQSLSQCYGVVKIPSPPPPSVTLKGGKNVGVVMMPTGNYLLEFTITIRATVPNWGSIIHVTGTGGNCCNFGDRAPGIWLVPGGTALHIRIGDSTNGNWGIDTDPIPLNRPTNFSLKAENSNITIKLGNYKYNLVQPTRRPTGKFNVLMSDDWYTTANVAIDNFSYTVDGVPFSPMV